MEQRNNKQNCVIFQIEELLNKMSNQVRFLIRNEETMSQLDLDLMMKNTRKLYDTLCSIDVNEDESLQDYKTTSQQVEEDISLQDYKTTSQQVEDEDLLSHGLIDSLTPEISLQDYKTTSQQVEEDDLLSHGLIDSLTPKEDDERVDMVWDFTIEDVETQRRNDSENPEISQQDNESTSQQVEDEDAVTQRLSDSETPEMSLQDNESTSQQVEDEDLLSHGLIDSLTPKEDDSGIRAYRKTNNEYHTLGDVLEQTEDNSLAARLQRKPVSDLMTAIGINDKFLLLNELFNGSMEKYNKSIRALNSFSTLLGARTYMSELQIEFQWDCESEAYKKLGDLVERRFISIHNS